MKEHKHATKDTPETKPAQIEGANKSHGDGTPPHTGSDHADYHDHQNHHAHMAADFRNRFSISLALTAPILLLGMLIAGIYNLGVRISD